MVGGGPEREIEAANGYSEKRAERVRERAEDKMGNEKVPAVRLSHFLAAPPPTQSGRHFAGRVVSGGRTYFLSNYINSN